MLYLTCLDVFDSPFEVTDVGWGEFEVGIKIYFKNGGTANIDTSVGDSSKTDGVTIDPSGSNDGSSSNSSTVITPMDVTIDSSNSSAVANTDENTVSVGETAQPSMTPIELIQYLRLYHPVSDVAATQSKKPVVSEKYDEIVFKNPHPSLLRGLRAYGVSVNKKPYVLLKEQHTPFINETDNISHLTLVYNFIKEELKSKLNIMSVYYIMYIV